MDPRTHTLITLAQVQQALWEHPEQPVPPEARLRAWDALTAACGGHAALRSQALVTARAVTDLERLAAELLPAVPGPTRCACGRVAWPPGSGQCLRCAQAAPPPERAL